MRTVRMTMAQALVKFLDKQYIEFDGREQKFVKGFFTLFGHGNVLGIGQALEQDPGELAVHQGRNEQGMAHAAMGFAKQKYRKQIYACTSSVGPGAANMVTAAATALANRIPVLFLPGDTYASRQPDPVLQQVEHFHNPGISTNDAFEAVSKYWDRITRPEQIMMSAINAMRVLTDPAETGPVTIALPQDVQGEAYDYPEDFFKKRVHRIERRLPTKDMLQDAVELIKTRRKPLLICGGGVRYSEAAESFRKFAEKFNIPFSETQAGKSAVAWDHELNLGGIGATGNLSANLIAKDADLIIGVGTRYSDFTTSSKWLFQNPDVTFLNLNIAAFDSYKLDAVKVTADAGAALEALTEELGKIGYRSAYTGEIKEAKANWAEELNRLCSAKYAEGFVPEVAGDRDEAIREFGESLGSFLTQTQVLGILNEMLEEDAIVVGSSGSLPGDMQRMWNAKTPGTYHMEYGYSCMGYEVNAALGVKIACPDKEVYSMVGDGSYMMSHSELITSIQEGKKINVMLMDNLSFGCINNLQMGQGMGNFCTEFRFRNPETGKLDGKLIPVDFAANAGSYGCKTYRVTTEEELRAAVIDARRQKVSTLLDIKVLPKTMTHGYESWWRVGNAEVAREQKIVEITGELKKELNKARRY